MILIPFTMARWCQLDGTLFRGSWPPFDSGGFDPAVRPVSQIIERKNQRRLLAVHKAVINCVENKFQTIGYSEFVEDVRKVMLGSILADLELFRQILVRISGDNKPNYLH